MAPDDQLSAYVILRPVAPENVTPEMLTMERIHELEFDPSQYTGSGVFLFASTLERFLGLYTSVNSFTQTVAKVLQHPGAYKRWAPRAGDMALL